MFDRSAIEAVQESSGISAASNSVESALASKALVALPAHYALHDIEQYLPTRRQARGTFKTNEIPSFIAYTTAHKEMGASVFINPKEMSAVAVLNFGTADLPGHCDNIADLKLLKTAVYKSLLETANGRQLTQSAAAEFLEDWLEEGISFIGEDGNFIDPRKAIAAFRKLTIEQMRKVEASEQQLGASRSTFESAKASSETFLPVEINFACSAYEALDHRTFVLRVSIITTDKPAIIFRIKNLQVHEEAMANELSTIIMNEFDDLEADELQIMLGQYEPT